MLPLHRVVVLLLFVNPAAFTQKKVEETISCRVHFVIGSVFFALLTQSSLEEVGRKDLLTWHPAHWTAMAKAADLNHSSLLNQ